MGALQSSEGVFGFLGDYGVTLAPDRRASAPRYDGDLADQRVEIGRHLDLDAFAVASRKPPCRRKKETTPGMAPRPKLADS